MREPLPLATIHEAVLEFLAGREDAVLFGAQAVNAYVEEPRMTQDVDIVSTRAGELAQELREHLAGRFHIAVRVRELAPDRAYRVFQIQKPRNRHIADVRAVSALPPAQRLGGVLVPTPDHLVATKVISFKRRRGAPKSGTDWRDIAALLLRFPELKQAGGAVEKRLRSEGADEATFAAWRDIVGQHIEPDEDEGSPT